MSGTFNIEEANQSISTMARTTEEIENLISTAKRAATEAHEQAQRAQFAAQQADEQLGLLQNNLHSLRDLLQEMRSTIQQLEQ